MKKIKLNLESLWLLAGAVEELRSNGVQIPGEADEIVCESLININVATYMRDQFPAKHQRLLQIIESLEVPDHLQDTYAPTPITDQKHLAPFKTTHFLEDRVLGVGLKSYPYVIDANGDGKKDLLVGDHDGFIYVFLNENTDADPVFRRGERLLAVDTQVPLVVQPNPKMSFGDLTGTGSSDIVLGNYAGRVAFVPNRATDGTLQFAMADAHFLRTAEGEIDVENYAYPELVDFRGDGHFDLVVGNISGRLLRFKNAGHNGEPLFEPGVEIPGIEPLMYPCPFFVDLNGDGRKDLILGHRNGSVILYKNVGTNEQPSFERHDVARHIDGRPVDVGLLSHPVAVDWNNDGLVDLVVGNDPGQVQVFLNQGTTQEPVFEDGLMLRDEGGELIMGVHSIFAMTDFDGNGQLDLLVGHETDRLRLFSNVGTAEAPKFDDFHEVKGVVMNREHLEVADEAEQHLWDLEGLEFNTEYLGNLAPCCVDWFNRGKLDLLIGHYTGLVYLFANEGTREEPRYTTGRPLMAGSELLRVAGFSTPVVCDWNNDGKKDLVMGDLLGRIHVFCNIGSDEEPAFAQSRLIEVEGEPVLLGPRSIVEVADLDGDGRKDLLVGNRFGGVYALLNTGADAEPRFDTIEQLEDNSELWRHLYAGCQHSIHPSLRKSYERLPKPGQSAPMNVVETSCPRVCDMDNDGNLELLISHRYGRVFVYNEVPNPRKVNDE